MVIDKIHRIALNPNRSLGTARVSYLSIFISHAWQFGDDYDRLIKMLNQGLGQSQWQNLSAEQNRPADPTGEALGDLIGRADVVIVLSGMYSRHEDAMQSEITIASNLGKPIISLVPWGQQHGPESLRQISVEEVEWASNRICNSVKKWG